MFTASLGLVMTCVYLWGLLERRDRQFLRMGIDSIIVLALYLGGLVVLYTIK
jgi:cation:H+ antiporter